MLEFRSNNAAHRPVIDALTLIARYARAGNLTYHPIGETVPSHRGTAGDWSDLVYRIDTRTRQRVARMVYEVVTSRRYASNCDARRSGSSAPTRGATPMRICRPTSSSAAARTTASCASP